MSEKYPIKLPPEQQREWLLRYIIAAQSGGFFGEFTIEFKEGSIVMVKKTETFRPGV